LSEDWVKDIADMHDHYGMTEGFDAVTQDPEKARALLRFRLDFVQEEITEMNKAFDEKNPEEIIDALIDICVVAIGTLDAFNIDAHRAWDAVLEANMSKQAGIKPSRPNPFGLPDLIKPEGWTAPDHSDNHHNMYRGKIWPDADLTPGPCDV
jgi:predicted HAD superfamily Cof-like phosphohydrolase